jgi:hypothetical protein
LEEKKSYVFSEREQQKLILVRIIIMAQRHEARINTAPDVVDHIEMHGEQEIQPKELEQTKGAGSSQCRSLQVKTAYYFHHLRQLFLF